MEAGEELRLSRAGFRPVRRRYVVTALLAAVAAMTAELWTIHLHATWPEACFKPWRSSLALLLHAFLTALRLVCSSTRKLCSYYGTYHVCVGLVSLLLISHWYTTIADVILSASSQRLTAVLIDMVEGKYVVDGGLETEHVLNKRLSWNSSYINEKSNPFTEWRYIGESVKFTCLHSIPSSIDLITCHSSIVWVHNGSVIKEDDPRYDITHRPVSIHSVNNGPSLYKLTLELTIGFVEGWHFGEYDCVSLLAIDRPFTSNAHARNPTDPRQGKTHYTHAGFKRIGRVHLKQIIPETRVMVIPVGGIVHSAGSSWLLFQNEQDDISFEYTVNGKEIISFLDNYTPRKAVRTPFMSAYLVYRGLSLYVPPFFLLFMEMQRYSFVYVIPFPPMVFGEHQLTLYRDVTNSTTGKRELREVKFPVTFIFKPSPPILMELFFQLSNISDVTVNDLSDPFFAVWADLCIVAEGLVLFYIALVVTVVAILIIKLTIQKVLVPLWHVIFLFGFQPPPQETLADICVTQPREPELRYDVFVSYASEDSEDRYFVLHVLLPQLQRLGLSVCLPERERAPNETELRGTSHLVQACSFYIVVVTPSYIECAICNRLELPFILSRFQYREVNDHQVVLVKLRACIIPGGLHCSLPVVDLTRDEGQGHLNDVIRDWNPQNRLRANRLIRHFH